MAGSAANKREVVKAFEVHLSGSEHSPLLEGCEHVKEPSVHIGREFCWGDIIFSGGTLFLEVPYGEGSPETFTSRSEKLIMANEVFE
jgi:hypothetical protein